MKAIIGEFPITEQFVYDGISCVFRTLTLQTTLTYILLSLLAVNKREGGIFTLYALGVALESGSSCPPSWARPT